MPELTGPITREILDRPLPELGDVSWPDKFRSELTRAQNEMEARSMKLGAILLTGGASRMGFIRDILEEVITDVEFTPDNEPEFCIARGLSRWGKVHQSTEELQKKVHSDVLSTIEPEVRAQLPNLQRSLSKTLAEGIMNESFVPKMKDWQQGNITTLADMEDEIKSSISSWLNSKSGQNLFSEEIGEWYSQLQEELTEKLKPIFDNYGVSMSELRIEATDLSGGRSLSGGSDISKVISGVVGGVVTMVIAGVGTFLAVVGPIGWIATIIAAGGALFLGSAAGDATGDFVKGFDVPKMLRGRILSDKKIEEVRKEEIEGIRKQIEAQIFSGSADAVDSDSTDNSAEVESCLLEVFADEDQFDEMEQLVLHYAGLVDCFEYYDLEADEGDYKDEIDFGTIVEVLGDDHFSSEQGLISLANTVLKSDDEDAQAFFEMIYEGYSEDEDDPLSQEEFLAGLIGGYLERFQQALDKSGVSMADSASASGGEGSLSEQIVTSVVGALKQSTQDSVDKARLMLM